MNARTLVPAKVFIYYYSTQCCVLLAESTSLTQRRASRALHQNSTKYQQAQDLQYCVQARPKHPFAPSKPPNYPNPSSNSAVSISGNVSDSPSSPSPPNSLSINQADAHPCKNGDRALLVQPGALGCGGSSGRGGGICCRSCWSAASGALLCGGRP
jgi:hypothetical protein